MKSCKNLKKNFYKIFICINEMSFSLFIYKVRSFSFYDNYFQKNYALCIIYFKIENYPYSLYIINWHGLIENVYKKL